MCSSLLYLSIVSQDPWYAMSDYTCVVCSRLKGADVCPPEMSSMEFMSQVSQTMTRSDLMRGHLAPLPALQQANDKRFQNNYYKSLVEYLMQVAKVDYVTDKSIKESTCVALTSSYSVYA